MFKINLGKSNIIRLSDIDYVQTLAFKRKHQSEMLFLNLNNVELMKHFLSYYVFVKNKLTKMKHNCKQQ
jgi:hypothetical protein